jgi:hypothetical protein
MADFSITGHMKVGTLKERFHNEFGSLLRVYAGVKFADDDATVSSIAKKTVKRGSEVKAHGRTKVINFENAMKEIYGIRVQVAAKDDSKLVDNELTLAQSGK